MQLHAFFLENESSCVDVFFPQPSTTKHPSLHLGFSHKDSYFLQNSASVLVGFDFSRSSCNPLILISFVFEAPFTLSYLFLLRCLALPEPHLSMILFACDSRICCLFHCLMHFSPQEPFHFAVDLYCVFNWFF